MASSVYSRTFQKAAELIGGYAKLCRHLQVPPDKLQQWILDKAVPPMGIFLRAVDLLLDETPAPPGGDAGETPAPRDCAAGTGSSPTWL